MVFADFATDVYGHIPLFTAMLLGLLSLIQWLRVDRVTPGYVDKFILYMFMYSVLTAVATRLVNGWLKIDEREVSFISSAFAIFVVAVFGVIMWGVKPVVKLGLFAAAVFMIWFLVSGHLEWQAPIVVVSIVILLFVAYRRESFSIVLTLTLLTIMYSLVLVYTIFVVAENHTLNIAVEDIRNITRCDEERECVIRVVVFMALVVSRLCIALYRHTRRLEQDRAIRELADERRSAPSAVDKKKTSKPGTKTQRRIDVEPDSSSTADPVSRSDSYSSLGEESDG